MCTQISIIIGIHSGIRLLCYSKALRMYSEEHVLQSQLCERLSGAFFRSFEGMFDEGEVVLSAYCLSLHKLL